MIVEQVRGEAVGVGVESVGRIIMVRTYGKVSVSRSRLVSLVGIVGLLDA